MSLHADLLGQAHQLATLDPGRPKQANLRRAVSSAYYGLFHFLIDASVRRLVRRAGGQAHRDLLARAFQHGEMKTVARSIAGNTLPRWWFGPAPSADLAGVGRAFVRLQDARHDADYDRTRVFTRAEALDLVGLATTATETWIATVSGTAEGDLFLIALLARKGFDRP